MANVSFTVHHRFDAAPRAVWDELVDWAGHANWVPATRVQVEPGDPLAVGAEFTAWTGYGLLTLEDRMRVAAIEWTEAIQRGACTVDKLGPLLSGTAGFVTEPARSGGTNLTWIEDVHVPRVPQFLVPIANRLGAAGFKLVLISLARKMSKTTPSARA